VFALQVRVNPGAARTAVGGAWSDPKGGVRLIVRVAAKAVDGEANRTAEAAVARAFGLPKSAVGITAGEKSRLKTMRLDADPVTLAARLAALLKGPAP
jgi:hypothetical protein